jgi:hypothetical protein
LIKIKVLENKEQITAAAFLSMARLMHLQAVLPPGPASFAHKLWKTM